MTVISVVLSGFKMMCLGVCTHWTTPLKRLLNLNIYPLEVVARYSDPQLEVGKIDLYKSVRFK